MVFLNCEKAISRKNIIQSVFPVWSYAYLALLPFTSAAAELIGHKVVVLLGAACRFATALLLLWPLTDGSIVFMQLSQATIAVGFAAHPALSAIMYRGLARESFTQGAGYVAATGVAASVIASLLGQLLLITAHVDLYTLVALSTVFTGAALLFAFLFPSRQPGLAKPSLYNGLLPSEYTSRLHLAQPINESVDEAAPTPTNAFAAPTTSVGGSPASATSVVVQGSEALAIPFTAHVSGVSGAASNPSAPHISSPLAAAGASDGRGAAQNEWSRARISLNGGGGDVCCGVDGCCGVMDGFERARALFRDTARTLRHSGAVYYYAWLSVATAVHHLVVTYWQAAVPHAHSPPPPPPAVHAAIRAFGTAPSFLHAPLPESSPHVGAHAMYPSAGPNYVPGVELLAPLDIDGLTNASSCMYPAGESANGYTQAVAALLGGGAALLPMLGERSLRESGCAQLRELLMLAAPLVLAALLYLMSVVESCAMAHRTGLAPPTTLAANPQSRSARAAPLTRSRMCMCMCTCRVPLASERRRTRVHTSSFM